jgi:APA family basic amino acid/polyamine antiporter
LRYRAKNQEQKAIFKIKGYPVLPAFYILVYLIVNISVFYKNPEAALSGFILFLAGFPLYYLVKYALRKKV